ncbi:MAG: CRISPR-associated helicase Cas3' [Raineya sp.]|nr:CRISPR-associated helicase Cas3' [Raineya sp.]
MCNYIKTFREILQQSPKTEDILIEAENYYAHISDSKAPEKLAEHNSLVQEKFLFLCEQHGLDEVVNKLISDLLENEKNNANLINYVKRLFVNVVVFHDYGKVNENFQVKKMNNSYFKENSQNPLKDHHSALGAYLYIVKHCAEIENSFKEAVQKARLTEYTLAFSYVIFKHHASKLISKEDIIKRFLFSPKEISFLKSYLAKYQFEISDHLAIKLFENNPNIKKINVAWVFEKETRWIEKFSFYALMRLAFSLLTAADYLASCQYANNLTIKDLGVLDRSRIEQIYEFVTKSDFLDKNQEKINFNKYIYQDIDTRDIPPAPQEASKENLNILRKRMAIEVIKNVRENSLCNLFYIEAPTGGGKTNLSLLATLELLKANKNLNKVFYVFPFTTLITQTYRSILENLGLKESEIIELHSKAPFPENEAHDGKYGKEKLNYLDYLFANYPFVLLSHIKFFDIFKTNEKESNYLLHRLANAVVVIDELQSYPPSHWDKIIYFIRNYAEFFNIKFILMSATLPRLDRLTTAARERENLSFVDLLPNVIERYFQNPNFAQRVQFRFDLLEQKEMTFEELAKKVFEKSIELAAIDLGSNKPQNSVFSIVEFIFKRSATQFYYEVARLQETNPFFDEIFVLSGTILEHRRRFIIDFLKNPTNRYKKILLITTQVVEAGVDIDMDLGFKNISLIDSDEQLAGRINRNVGKKGCELYLFKINEPAILYRNDKRYEVTKKLSKEEYTDILEKKDFDKLYKVVLEKIDEWNKTDFAVNFENYKNHVLLLNFEKTHRDFQLIEQKTLSIFVPMSIPVEVFSETELNFLRKANILPDAADKIEGSAVFDLYIELVENKKNDFFTQKIEFKIMQAILAKFTFSIFYSEPMLRKFIPYADIEKTSNQQGELSYGFLYLARYTEIYDECFGLRESEFESSEHCLL